MTCSPPVQECLPDEAYIYRLDWRGKRIVYPFHLKRHRSIRPLQHHNLARPLPCLPLPLMRTMPHLLNNFLPLLIRVTPQARCLQARIRAPALNRTSRSSTLPIPQGRHISSLGQTCQKRKGGCGEDLDSSWKHSHSPRSRGRLHSSGRSRQSNRTLLPWSSRNPSISVPTSLSSGFLRTVLCKQVGPSTRPTFPSLLTCYPCL